MKLSLHLDTIHDDFYSGYGPDPGSVPQMKEYLLVVSPMVIFGHSKVGLQAGFTAYPHK